MEQRRRRRTAPRLAGLLACAAVPVLLVSGCSSGSGGGDGSGAKATSPSGTKTGANGGASGGTSSATAAPAKFATLPAPCKAVTKATVTALVPKAKSPAGTAEKSGDLQSRGSCHWTGNGTDGYQYRWLSVTLQRFGNDPQLGSGEEQATKRFTTQLQEVGKAAYGAPTSPVTGIGDQAAQVSGRTTVAKVTSQNDTVLVRAGNVLVLVEYDGAGLEGKKNPSADTMKSGAQRAAKEAVAALAAG